MHQSIKLLLILLFAIIVCSCNPMDDSDSTVSTGATNAYWTIMIYADADNNLEPYMMYDIEEIASSLTENHGVNVITLVDRIDGFSEAFSVFGENFTDTRLYKIGEDKAERLNGGSLFPEIKTTSHYEANMGDATTLKKFIQYCKANYPTDNYALILWDHGGGTRGPETDSNNDVSKAVCWDETNDGDCLFIGEISDVLTENESVDMLGFDACVMGSAEIAYQYRPRQNAFHADVMVASPPNEWGLGWKYDRILERISSGGGESTDVDTTSGGKEKYYDPQEMTALDLGRIIVEEQYDSTSYRYDQAMSCYDLSKSAAVKTAVDQLAVTIYNEAVTLPACKTEFEKIRGTLGDSDAMRYFNINDERRWIATPYFDLYDLCNRITKNYIMSITASEKAQAVMQAVDDMITCSFGGAYFNGGFTDGKNGVYVFFPDGDKEYYLNDPESGIDYVKHFELQWWYNAIDLKDISASGYGNMFWCSDGAIQGNSTVENWFEMLDAWYDTGNPGSNVYMW